MLRVYIAATGSEKLAEHNKTVGNERKERCSLSGWLIGAGFMPCSERVNQRRGRKRGAERDGCTKWT